MTEKKRIPINIPDIGSANDEIRFISWLLNTDDRVEIDDDLFEIETDKAVFVAGAEHKGVVVAQDVSAQGTVVTVGQNIGWLEVE